MCGCNFRTCRGGSASDQCIHYVAKLNTVYTTDQYTAGQNVSFVLCTPGTRPPTNRCQLFIYACTNSLYVLAWGDTHPPPGRHATANAVYQHYFGEEHVCSYVVVINCRHRLRFGLRLRASGRACRMNRRQNSRVTTYWSPLKHLL